MESETKRFGFPDSMITEGPLGKLAYWAMESVVFGLVLFAFSSLIYHLSDYDIVEGAVLIGLAVMQLRRTKVEAAQREAKKQ